MNARNLFDFLRSPPGLLVLFIGGLAGALFFLRSSGWGANPRALEATRRGGDQPQTIQRIGTGVQEAKFPSPSATRTPVEQIAKREKKEESITLYAVKTRPKRLSSQFAPYGRLVKCQLVVTVDSATIETPIIGLVTEDVNHDGRLIIPAGTEVHGRAMKSHMRDRIGTESSWILVFREKSAGFENGQELTVEGFALDMEEVSSQEKWAITDGSAGLRGEVLKTDDFQEIKLFAATAISGLAGGLQNSTFSAATGTVFTPGNLQNALSGSAASVANRYAEQILDTIEKDGYFVRVAAGKQFYLYITQTVDEADARVGSQLKVARKKEAEAQNVREPVLPDSLSAPLSNLQRAINNETNP